MHEFPHVSALSVVVAAVAAFVVGGFYYGLIAGRLTKALGEVPSSARWATSALVIALVTRVVQAFALAVLLGFAGVSGVLSGAAGGALAFCGFLLPISVGQAGFGTRTWTDLLVGSIEAVAGFAVMGAVIGAWPGH